MNEKPGETANPLNAAPAGQPNPSSLDANPSEPVVGAPTNPAVDLAADPMARPMEKADTTAPAAPVKKKKTGLIAGIIAAIVVLIGGGVAAAIILMNADRGDAVSRAIAKIASGDVPENIIVDGTIKMTPTTDNSPIKSVAINLNTQAATSSLINSSVATLTADFATGDNIEMEIDEIYAANGDLYLKVEGMSDAIEAYADILQDTMDSNDVDSTTDTVEVTETEDTEEIEETVDTNGAMNILGGYGEMFEYVDGEWIKISLDDLSRMLGITSTEDAVANDVSTCALKLANDVKQNSNSIAELYNKHAFVQSSTEGVTLASKGSGPVYKVVLDGEALTDFANEFNNSVAIRNYYNCLGQEAITSSNVSALTDAVKQLPVFYVELDQDDNFTRFYFEKTFDGATTVDCYCTEDDGCDPCPSETGTNTTVDLNFSYPNTINVAEPTEYTDFNTLLQRIFMNMYSMPAEEVVVTE